MVKKHGNIAIALVRISSLHFHTVLPEHIGFASTAMAEGLKVMIPMPSELKESEVARLEKEQEKVVASIEKIRVQLDNKEFVDRAPPALIQKQRDLLMQTESKLEEIRTKLIQLTTL